MVMLLKAVVTIQNSLKAGVLVWLQYTILLKALSPAVKVEHPTEWCVDLDKSKYLPIL